MEAWEINLKKMLAEGVKNESWETQLQAELQSPKPKNSMKSYLILAIVVFVLANAYVLNEKNHWYELPQLFPVATQPEKPRVDHLKQIKSAIATLQKNQASQEAKLQTTSDRLSTLGMIFNEDMAILSQNIDKRKVIVLNEDWTLDRMPTHLKLTPQDAVFLQKYVRKNQK